jgi:hypothetical protein
MDGCILIEKDRISGDYVMRIGNTLVLFYFYVLVMYFIIGCSYHYTSNDILGIWESKEGGRIEFTSHGFHASCIPRFAILDEQNKSSYTCSGSGEWSIKDESINLYNFQVVCDGDRKILESGMNTYMTIVGKGHSMKIHFVIGDPDSMNYFEFTRRVSSNGK